MAEHKLVGEILLEQGLATRQQIAAALIEGRRLGKSVGQVLLQRNIITIEQLDRALSLQEEEDLSILPAYSLILYATQSARRDEFVQFLHYVRPGGQSGLVDTVDLTSFDNPDLVACFSEWDSPRACRAYLTSQEIDALEEELRPHLAAPPERHQFRSIGDYRRVGLKTRVYFLVVSKVQKMSLSQSEQRTSKLESALSNNPSVSALRSGSAMDDSMYGLDLIEWVSFDAYKAHRTVAGSHAPEIASQPWRDGPPFTFIHQVPE
jgi:hypothetical protein